MAKNSPRKGKSTKNVVESTKKQNATAKVAPSGVTKAKTSTKPNFIPEEIAQHLNRKQKSRLVQRIVKTLRSEGIEDFQTVDTNHASIKEILDNVKINKTKGKKSEGNKA